MSIRLFLRITAFTTAIIGLGLIVFPVTVVNMFLVDPLENGTIFIRFLGSALIGYSFLNAYSSKYHELKLVTANLVGNFATLVVAFFLSLGGLVSGSLNSAGILIVLLHLVFGLGFGYYLQHLKHGNH